MNTKNFLSITEARKNIFKIIDQVQQAGQYFTLTDKGKPKAVVISAEEYESLLATIEVLSDPKAMAMIKKSEEEIKRGEYVTWEQVEKELGFSSDKPFMVADKSKKKYGD